MVDTNRHGMDVHDSWHDAHNNTNEIIELLYLVPTGPSNNSPRASIVFKKSLPGPGGKRGHGVVKNTDKSMNPKTTVKTTVKKR